MGDPIANLIRGQAATIAADWHREVDRDPVLADQGPALLAALADWMDGDPAQVDHAFGAMVDSPAFARLGYGIGLETLTGELSKLRVAVLRKLVDTASPQQLIRLNEGLDRGISEAVRHCAERREQVRDLFIGILGHDLRDPLTTIRIVARILGKSSKLKPHADRIEHACSRMQRLVDDVLDFARGHLGGGIPAMPAPADMAALCRAAADEIAAANPTRPLDVKIQGDLHGNFDRDRVIQALANLLSNAVHHGTGPIELAAYENGAMIVTSVTNHGAPIPPGMLAHIFDPFARGWTPHAGLGLGLYIVQQIAQAHGTTCNVTSSPEATTFTIRWPRALALAHKRAG